MAKPGNLGTEPRLFEEKGESPPTYDAASATSTSHGVVRPQGRKLHDPSVTFEEYYYYAQQTRAQEAGNQRHGRETSLWSIVVPSKSDGGVEQVPTANADGERHANLSDRKARAAVSDEEWANASRALRTATRGAVFYLITTDILGPFGLPYAFATMGWG